MALVARIRELAIDYHDDEILATLRDDGQKSMTTSKPITMGTIKWLRYKYRIPAPPPPNGTLNVRQVRERYGVSLWVVHYWIERGIVPAVQRRWNAPYAITIDKELGSAPSRMDRYLSPSSYIIPNPSCMRCTMPAASQPCWIALSSKR
jgi:hypothetical protein